MKYSEVQAIFGNMSFLVCHGKFKFILRANFVAYQFYIWFSLRSNIKYKKHFYHIHRLHQRSSYFNLLQLRRISVFKVFNQKSLHVFTRVKFYLVYVKSWFTGKRRVETSYWVSMMWKHLRDIRCQYRTSKGKSN